MNKRIVVGFLIATFCSACTPNLPATDREIENFAVYPKQLSEVQQDSTYYGWRRWYIQNDLINDPAFVTRIRDAATQDNPYALWHLANTRGGDYQSDEKTVQSFYARAVQGFEKLDAKGDVGATYLLAHYYITHVAYTVTSQDEVKSFTLLLKAANKGFPPAQADVGYAYKNSTGVAPDEQSAKQWFQLAALAGFDRAQLGLAEMLWNSSEKIEALKWFHSCAMLGHPICINYLARAYDEGIVMRKDPVKSFAWQLTTVYLEGNTYSEPKNPFVTQYASNLSSFQISAAEKMASQLVEQIKLHDQKNPYWNP